MNKEKNKTKPKNSTTNIGSKPKTITPQAPNPFVDKYLEFYDDIKIPSRRYDW